MWKAGKIPADRCSEFRAPEYYLEHWKIETLENADGIVGEFWGRFTVYEFQVKCISVPALIPAFHIQIQIVWAFASMHT
jgi:hypothetical protein